MGWEEILLIVLAAFVCELIDSSLGMLYGTIRHQGEKSGTQKCG